MVGFDNGAEEDRSADGERVGMIHADLSTSVDLVAASRPTVPGHPDFIAEYVAWGAGLRASQNIAFIAKATAAMHGRDTVKAEDIRKAIVPVLRHRIGLSFRAEVDRVSVEEIIRRLVQAVPEPAAA